MAPVEIPQLQEVPRSVIAGLGTAEIPSTRTGPLFRDLWLHLSAAMAGCPLSRSGSGPTPKAKAALPHGECEAMVATDLPFSTSTARKLREIAAFVDEGQVPLEPCLRHQTPSRSIRSLAEVSTERGQVHCRRCRRARWAGRWPLRRPALRAAKAADGPSSAATAGQRSDAYAHTILLDSCGIPQDAPATAAKPLQYQGRCGRVPWCRTMP